MSEPHAMSSRARLISRTPVSVLAAFVGLVAITGPTQRLPQGLAKPDTLAAFTNPTGIAVDASGAVYVASAGDSSIVVFAPGARGRAKPIRRIGGPGSGLGAPRGIAIDSRGRLLVSLPRHEIKGKGSITVYGPTADGNARPIRTIVGADTKLETPVGIALGRRGRIYVANGTGEVKYGPNTSVGYGGRQATNAVVAFDASADGNAAPRQSLPDTPGSSRPLDISTDTAGNLVTVNGSEVVVWGDHGPVRRVFKSKEQPGGNFIFEGGSTFLDPGAEISALPLTRVAVGPGGALYLAPRFATPPPQPDSARAKQDFFATIRRLRSDKAVGIYNGAESSDTVPQRIIGGSQSSMAEIRDMAVGRDGALYILAHARVPGGEQSSIVIFAPTANGDAEPARVIAGPCTRMNNPVAIAVDRTNRVYVASNFGGDDPTHDAASVAVYAADASGDAAPIRWIAGPRTRLLAPTALVAADDGTVYVANAATWNDDTGSLRVYAHDATGTTPPLRTIIGTQTRLLAPTGLALGPSDTLYALGQTTFYFGATRVAVFAPSSRDEALPVRTLEGSSTRLAGPTALALDDDGRLYVANNKEASGLNAYGPDLGSVSVYERGVAANTAPTRTIEGGFTKLNGPSGIARDRVGRIYVANRWGTGPGSVTIYGPQANEDERPLRMLAGPATGLQSPAGLALDAHDTLYVVNASSVTVYAPNATGDTPPLRTIQAR